MVVLDVTDLFAFGIGCDVAGAYLLARGLLVGPPTLAWRAGTYYGIHIGRLLGQVEDRVTGMFGVASLIFGFVVQAAGYVVVLGIGTPGEHSLGRAIGAVVAAVVPAVAVVAIERALRRRLVRRMLVRVARVNAQEGRHDDLPDATLLAFTAPHLGRPRHDGETATAYARRAFGVDEVRESSPADG